MVNFLKSQVGYARVTGAILFVFGLVGFAFRGVDSVPDVYLLAAILLGFWGIVVSFTQG